MKRLITLAIALFAALAVVVLDRSLGTATILDNETAPPTWVTVGRAYPAWPSIFPIYFPHCQAQRECARREGEP